MDLHGLDSYGYLCEYPEAKIHALSEEHGHVDFSACARKPEIGERVSIYNGFNHPRQQITKSAICRGAGQICLNRASM